MALQDEDDTKAELDTLREYLKRRQTIAGELQLLKDDMKELDDEFADKLDLKSLRLAFSVAKAKAKVAHKFTFENFLSTLEDEGWTEGK